MARKGLRARVALMIGVDCPLCGRKMLRERTPRRFRVFRWLLPGRTSYRLCLYCKYRGLALHGRKALESGEV